MILRRLTILDRYIAGELTGPFLFGLSAFTIIFVATQILAISKFVSDEHVPLVVAVLYFLWQMPAYLLLVIPMALLLGTLLAVQRLSSDSEITALKAGGIGLARIVRSLLVVGFVVSLIALGMQEILVPIADEQAAYLKATAIQHASPLGGNLSVILPLPNGGKQVTFANAIDEKTQTLLGVTVMQYDSHQNLVNVIVSPRARFDAPTWTFLDATSYALAGNDTTFATHPQLTVDIGEQPSAIAQRANISDPEQLSRADIHARLQSGQLSPRQIGTYTATYAAKLARPFASFVFTLIAVPFGLRQLRGGGGTGVGFGLAVAIVFVYYVIATLFLTVGQIAPWLAGIAAWTPNILFTAFGLVMLRRAAAV